MATLDWILQRASPLSTSLSVPAAAGLRGPGDLQGRGGRTDADICVCVCVRKSSSERRASGRAAVCVAF